MPKREPVAPLPELAREQTGVHTFEELSDADLLPVEEEEIELTDADLIGEVRSSELRSVESREAETRLAYGAATEASIEHPDRNEDSFFQSPSRGLQLVADGMGGVPAGDHASAKAAEQLTREGLAKASPETQHVMLAGREEVQDKKAVETAIANIITQMDREIVLNNQSNEAIRAKAMEYFVNEVGDFDEADPRHKAMYEGLLKSIGATVSMSKIWRGQDGKDHLTVGNVGDSRTYRLRNGNLEKLTKDSSHVQILIDEGLLKDDEDVNATIDKQAIEALKGKYPEIQALIPSLSRTEGPTVTLDSIRNRITMAAGVGELMKKQYGADFKPFVQTYDMEDGDIILTMTDGVIDNLTDSEIHAIALLHSDTPLELAKSLQQAATERSIRGKSVNARAKKDDVTALVTRYAKNGKK